MYASQFTKMQHVAQLNEWTKFVSMQDQYNLVSGVVQRAEEKEMFPLLTDQGVGSLPWSPLVAGVVAPPWGANDSERGKGNPSADFDGRPLWQDSAIDTPRSFAMRSVASAGRDVLLRSRWPLVPPDRA